VALKLPICAFLVQRERGSLMKKINNEHGQKKFQNSEIVSTILLMQINDNM
jgi:hypothetical protein